MHRRLRASPPAEHLVGARGDHLVEVHVALGCRAVCNTEAESARRACRRSPPAPPARSPSRGRRRASRSARFTSAAARLTRRARGSAASACAPRRCGSCGARARSARPNSAPPRPRSGRRCRSRCGLRHGLLGGQTAERRTTQKAAFRHQSSVVGPLSSISSGSDRAAPPRRAGRLACRVRHRDWRRRYRRDRRGGAGLLVLGRRARALCPAFFGRRRLRRAVGAASPPITSTPARRACRYRRAWRRAIFPPEHDGIVLPASIRILVARTVLVGLSFAASRRNLDQGRHHSRNSRPLGPSHQVRGDRRRGRSRRRAGGACGQRTRDRALSPAGRAQAGRTTPTIAAVPTPANPDDGPDKPAGGGGEVVRLDRFRKK